MSMNEQADGCCPAEPARSCDGESAAKPKPDRLLWGSAAVIALALVWFALRVGPAITPSSFPAGTPI